MIASPGGTFVWSKDSDYLAFLGLYLFSFFEDKFLIKKMKEAVGEVLSISNDKKRIFILKNETLCVVDIEKMTLKTLLK